MSNRPSGVLTSTDQEFLRTEDPYYEGENARQSRYERRRDIRRRIVTSLLDFQEIAAYLGEDERRKIFSEPEKNGAEDFTEFKTAVESLLGWLYTGFREEGSEFSSILESAIIRAEREYQATAPGRVTDVAVDLDINVTNRYDDIENIGRALEEGDTILARNIYKLPEFSDIPVEPEKVDTVCVLPEKGQLEPEKEKQIIKNILRVQLGIEAEIVIEGLATLPEGSDATEGSDN